MASFIYDTHASNQDGRSHNISLNMEKAQDLLCHSISSKDKKKLKLQLKTLKRDRSVAVYIIDIKRVIDALIGAPITEEDHIEAILDDLPKEYDSFVTSILSRLDPYTIDEIEALLLDQEERMEKHRFYDSMPQANVVVNSWNGNNTRGKSNHCLGRSSRTNQSTRHGKSFNSCNPTRTQWFSQVENSSTKIQCQICHKPGHSAPKCWHKFKEDYQPPPQAHNSQTPSLSNDQTYQLSSTSTLIDTLWYPDSKACHHITNDPSTFSSKSSYTGN